MKKLSSVVVLLLICLFSAYAYSWSVDDCNITVNVGRNAVHSVSEQYTMNYAQPKHGFYRYVPLEYKDAMNAKISSIQCSDEKTISYDDGFCIMQIGSASKQYTGLKDYSISYKYDLGSDLNDGYDEFYFNILGTDWDVPVENVSFTVSVDDLPYEDAKVWVVAGHYGSYEKVDFSVVKNANGFSILGNVKNLGPYNGITMRIQMPDNWYQNSRQYWDYRNIFTVLTILVSFALATITLVIWFIHGRDEIPIVSAKYNPPKGFSPLMVGYIADEQVDDKDITSMLYYWADQGLITINEKKKGKFSFTKIFDVPKDAPDFEKNLFDGFFKSADSTGTVTLESVRDSNFFECAVKTKVRVAKYFTKDKALYNSKNIIYQAICFVLSFIITGVYALSVGLYEPIVESVVAICVVGFFDIAFTAAFLKGLFARQYVRKTNFFATLLCVLPSLISIVAFYTIGVTYSGSAGFIPAIFTGVCTGFGTFFGVITQKRSEYGNKVLEDVMGYREYIDKVSMSQLLMMIDKNPEFYYHVLSYAIVLGLENTWAKKFENVTVKQPSWYIGEAYTDAFFYARMSSRLCSSVRMNAMTNVRKGGNGFRPSSFNFSGFAGGGFGGGGGRAW